MPVGVGFDVVAGEFPPPHAHNVSANTGASAQPSLTDRVLLAALSNARHPIIATAQIHDGRSKWRSHSSDRAVVVTLTLNVEGVVALSATLLGTEHVEPVGAPVQLSEAFPLIPAPPMDREYVAVDPAVTVADAAPPEATPSPTPGGVPDPPPEPVPLPPVSPVSATDCGLSLALSMNVKTPVAEPAAVGANVTLMVQDRPTPTDVPQLFVSAKGLAA